MALDITEDGFGGKCAHRFPSKIETLPVVKEPGEEKHFPSQQNKYPTIGFKCQVCGFDAKSSHGFARHVRTHGFGALGRHLGG